jgi:cobalt transporter subunit CbtB
MISTRTRTIADTRLTDRVAAVLTAALLGGFILFGVGFSTISTVHNAAHDTRHSFAFPCH